MRAKMRDALRAMGPGLVTGASDDDPSGIATYAQAGAAQGYTLLWTMPLTLPLMASIQETSARVGHATRMGIAANLRREFPRTLAPAVISLLALASVVNVGADLVAMGAALHLLVPVPTWAGAVGFAVVSFLVAAYSRYATYARLLRWSTLALLAYVGTVLAVHIPWRTALVGTLLPRFGADAGSLALVVAVLGTTMSPYLFFWQASLEAEGARDGRPTHPHLGALRRIRIDTVAGMALSNAVAWCIIAATAATLNAHGVRQVTSAQEAAEALRPLAGPVAFLLFALGIIGTGLLAVPVLAGSAAYAVAEGLRWRATLDRRPKQEPRFYAVFAAALCAGLGLLAFRVDPMRALVGAAVLNGLVAPVAMGSILLIATRRRHMGGAVVRGPLLILGWAATAVMAAVAVAMLGLLLVQALG